MPYVRRNAEGRITALLAEPEPGADESLPAGHADVLAFLGGAGAFSALDADFVRVTEDLIYTLIDRDCCSSPTCRSMPRENCASAKVFEADAFRARLTSSAGATSADC